ncbi:threonylcarbamoyl-AMP synthase [Tenacibaculum sp. SG-28]|nr:threonylcarbamoyl-AMP synthase [Tenacibaculum sp. SG-28]
MPTDTVWGIGCDATNIAAVNKVYEIKKRAESKSLIILVDSLAMLSKYIPYIPKKVEVLLKESRTPTTIIYTNPIGFPENMVAKDNTIAIRIPEDEFCKNLIRKFGKPIVSTSANISGNPTPKSFTEIESAILQSVDYIVNLHREKVSEKSSTILKIDGDKIRVLRE